MPATMHEAVRSCSSMEIRSDGAILGFLSSHFISSRFISSHSLFPPIVTKKHAEGKELFPVIGGQIVKSYFAQPVISHPYRSSAAFARLPLRS